MTQVVITNLFILAESISQHSMLFCQRKNWLNEKPNEGLFVLPTFEIAKLQLAEFISQRKGTRSVNFLNYKIESTRKANCNELR